MNISNQFVAFKGLRKSNGDSNRKNVDIIANKSEEVKAALGDFFTKIHTTSSDTDIILLVTNPSSDKFELSTSRDDFTKKASITLSESSDDIVAKLKAFADNYAVTYNFYRFRDKI